MDTTRADRMGFLGSTRNLTPHLDALAKQGIVFPRAYSQAPLTTVSHATILTGTYPSFHGVNDFAAPLAADVPDLAELFHARGYRTAAFVGALVLDPIDGMAQGFERGFDHYDAGFKRFGLGGEARYEALERRGMEVVAHAEAWLTDASAGPFFLWVHLFDPHEPYEAPEPYGRRYANNPYDGEIAYTDAAVGKLLEAVRTRGLYGNTLIAVAADHGEAFGEHGEYAHGVFLYDTTIHVPLVMKFHDGHWAGQRYAGRVSLVDVAPTIVAAAGFPVPREMQGRNLIPLLQRPPADLPSYAETQYPRRAFGWASLASLRTESFLYVDAPRRELYDLAADAEARENLAESRRTEVRRLASQLASFQKGVARVGPERQEPARNDPRLAEKLAALGYVAGGSTASAPNSALPDPKDKIHVANLLHTATSEMEAGNLSRGLPLLRKIIAGDPQIFSAQMQLGVALAMQRDYRNSVAALRRATELLPDSAQAHYALARSLISLRDFASAALHCEIVVGLLPQWAPGHYSLAVTYLGTNRMDQALERLRTVVKLDGRHFGARLLLGRLLLASGQAAQSLAQLERAVEVRPESPEAHRLLADAYERLGRPQEAARARAAATRLRGSTPPAEPPGS